MKTKNKYSAKEQGIFKLIENQDVNKLNSVGEIIKSISFKAGETALLIEPGKKGAVLFYSVKNDQTKNDRRAFAELVSLLNFIETVEANGLIYLQEAKICRNLMIYENFEDDFRRGASSDPVVVYNITKNEQITHGKIVGQVEINGRKYPQTDNELYIKKNGDIIMHSVDVSTLYDRIVHYLCYRPFPTSGLSRFIKNDYCFDEEKRSIRALSLSKISIVISLMALVLSSPWLSIRCSNKYGYSTINQEQFDTIIKKIENLDRSNTRIEKENPVDPDITKAKSNEQIQKKDTITQKRKVDSKEEIQEKEKIGNK